MTVLLYKKTYSHEVRLRAANNNKELVVPALVSAQLYFYT